VLLLCSFQTSGIASTFFYENANPYKDSTEQYIGGNTEVDYNYIYWRKPKSAGIKFYLLERSIYSDKGFTTISRINENGNKVMSFKDYSPKAKSYYRLLAFDSLGDFTIYNILSLDRTSENSQTFDLISTKDSHIFYIAYKSESNEPIRIEILKEGKVSIYKNTLIMNKGNNLIKLDLNFLPEGLYSIELHQNKQKYTQQFAMLNEN
jgi:ribosomal protein L33